MATLQQRITLLAQGIATDIKGLKTDTGVLANLTTTAKGNLVAAINELQGVIAAATNIDDTKGNGDTTFTWSADKIYDTIEAAKTAVKNDLLGGAAAAFDTLKELEDALGADASFATTIAAELNNRVRFDSVQSLTNPQKQQARDNIGAISGADLTAAIGDPDTDLVALYEAAKV